MKKPIQQFVRLLVLLAVLVTNATRTQAQTCATPLPININGCQTYTVSDTTVWLSFNSGAGATWCTINISVPPGNSNSIIGAELYSGTCTSPTLVQSAFVDINDYVITSGILPSSTYLIKVKQTNTTSGQLNVCSNIVTSATPCTACTTDGCQLVCNPDLETAMWPNSSQFPGNFMPLNVCNWTNPFGTPDYFTANGNTPQFPNSGPAGVPGNFAGTETPHSGIAYGGIYCYYFGSTNYREYIQQQLQAPLVAGEWYTLTFWVSLSDYSFRAVNHLGAFLSSNQPTSAAGLLTVTPQIFTATPIFTTNGWTAISGSFQASGTEQWITIGSFENDLVQQRPLVAPPPVATNPYASVNTDPNVGSYYYIDDITLIRRPDPCFTWQQTCDDVNFFNNSTVCPQLILSETWDFGDPSSGANNFSGASNPSHVYTQDNTQYTVTHTIQTAYGPYSCATQVTSQHGRPAVNIIGYQTNNCGNGSITYTASPCVPGVNYTWNVAGGSIVANNGCSVDVSWFASGGSITLNAVQIPPDCSNSVTLIIPPCCDSGQPGIRIDNMLASQVVAQYGNTITSSGDIYITGVFTVDAPITFLNCPLIEMGTNAVVNVNSGQTLTLSNCTTQIKCGYMWDGIYLANSTSTLSITNNSLIQQAKNAVVSNNGGRFFIQNSTMQNNYRDIVVNPYLGVHPGVVRSTDFVMNGSFLPAIPALPLGHNRTICAIEIYDNADITIGDATLAANRNRFINVAVGVRSNNSNTKVINGRFTNMIGNISIPNAGTAIVANGHKNVTYQAAINVGGAGLNKCVFTDMRIAIDIYDLVNSNILNNNISEIRLYGIRMQSCNQRSINIKDNLMTNASVTYGFNTGFLLLECYQSTVNITSNTILQTNTIGGQVGTGIRVSLVTPGDVILNIVNNISISRVRTGYPTGEPRLFSIA